MFCTSVAIAEDWLGELEVHGFISQGYLNTTANRFFGDSEDGSFAFHEIGINATFEANDRLRFSGQLLSFLAGDISDGTPAVDFALADYLFWSTPAGSAHLLAGRIKNPLGLYNEARDVPFTRPGIFLPHIIYFQDARTLALSSDGIGLRVDRYLEVGNIDVQFEFGTPIVDESLEYIYLGQSYAGDFHPVGISGIGRLLFTSHDESLRLGLSIASTELQFRPAAGDPLPTGSLEIPPTVASLQYALEEITLTMEYVTEANKYSGFAGTVFEGLAPSRVSYYAQAEWFADPRYSFVARYEEGYLDKDDRDGTQFAALTGLPAHSRFHKAWVLGGRWSPTPEFMVRGEFQITDGTMILSTRENPNPAATRQHWNMFSLTASYRF